MKRVETTITNRQKRDMKVRRFFAKIENKYPKWSHDSIMAETAEHFDKSIRTIKAILSEEGIYANS